jgi:hypothetical protein
MFGKSNIEMEKSNFLKQVFLFETEKHNILKKFFLYISLQKYEIAQSVVR